MCPRICGHPLVRVRDDRGPRTGGLVDMHAGTRPPLPPPSCQPVLPRWMADGDMPRKRLQEAFAGSVYRKQELCIRKKTQVR